MAALFETQQPRNEKLYREEEHEGEEEKEEEQEAGQGPAHGARRGRVG